MSGGVERSAESPRPRPTDVLERAHQARLLQAGQMLGGIVHEIRNPLAVIQGYAQLLHDKAPEGRDREDLSTILSETHRLAALIDDMLSFVRRGGEVAGKVDLGRVVQSAVNLMTHDMRQSRVEVVVDLAEGRPATVRGHHGAYVQVLLNLMGNARQSLEEGRSADRRIRLEVRPVEGCDRWQLVVANNGPPIPAEHSRSIFDPFFTTRQEGEGTGLGLALCRDLLARFGATVSLDVPTGDEGVAFRIDLPGG